jgi:hypothetical protein
MLQSFEQLNIESSDRRANKAILMEMKILGSGLATLNELVEGQRDRFILVENRQLELKDVLESIISDLPTQLTNELVVVVNQIDSALKLRFREQETRSEHIAGMIQRQNEEQKRLIIHLGSLNEDRATLIRGEAQNVDRILRDNFGFMKDYMDGMLTNQETLLKQILAELRKNPRADNLPWSHLNIQTYSQSTSFNQLMTAVPEFLRETRELLNAHYHRTNTYIVDVINFLNGLDVITRHDWFGFTDSLTKHIEGMTADIVTRALANFYTEQQKTNLMLEDLVRKSDLSKISLIEMFPRINTEKSEYWSNNKIMRRLREFRTSCKCLTEGFNEEFKKDLEFILLSIARITNNLTIQFDFDKEDEERYRRGELILDMQTQCCKKCEFDILEVVAEENYNGLLKKIAWEFGSFFDFMININKGRYVAPPSIIKWNIDENRKWQLLDMLQAECQDEELFRIIKESMAICNETFSHRDGDVLYIDELRTRSIARKTFEMEKRIYENVKRLMKDFYSIFDQDPFGKLAMTMTELTGWQTVTRNIAENVDLLNISSKEARESFRDAIDTVNINIENVAKLIKESDLQRDNVAAVAREFSAWKVGIQRVLSSVVNDLKGKLDKEDRKIITSRILGVRSHVDETFERLNKRFDEMGISLLNAVMDGTDQIKAVLLDKVDKGFIGKCMNLEREMGYLINTLPVYMNENRDLLKRIEGLNDISEYNSYMRKKIDDSSLVEEEILVLNRNQPSLDQLKELFTQQEAKFNEVRIQFSNENSTLLEELREIKEQRSKKSNIDAKLNKFKNSIITEVKFVENKVSALHSETILSSEGLKKSFNNMQHNIIAKVKPFGIIIKESAKEIIDEFKTYIQGDVVKRFEDNEPTRIIVEKEAGVLFDQVKNYVQEEIITRIEDREPFRIIVNDNATKMVNEFKEYMQSLEINTNFELTETIIQENFRELFDKLIETIIQENFKELFDKSIGRNTQVDNNFNLIQENLKALPNFKDMENFFSIMVKTDEVKKEFDAQRSFINNFHDDNILPFDLISSLITKGFNDISSTNKVTLSIKFFLNFICLNHD